MEKAGSPLSSKQFINLQCHVGRYSRKFCISHFINHQFYAFGKHDLKRSFYSSPHKIPACNVQMNIKIKVEKTNQRPKKQGHLDIFVSTIFVTDYVFKVKVIALI